MHTIYIYIYSIYNIRVYVHIHIHTRIYILYISRDMRERNEEEEEGKGLRPKFSARYGLLKKKKIKWEKKDYNLGNREHTIHRYLPGTTRSVSRVLVWGNGNEVAG